MCQFSTEVQIGLDNLPCDEIQNFVGVEGEEAREGKGLARGVRMAERRRDRGIIIPGTMCPGR